jgi:uncharacterized membrane protein YgcG
VAEDEFRSVTQLIIHEVTPGVTTRPPPGQDTPAQDSESIALIIVWTLVVFLLALCVISLVKSRCGKKQDPFSYKAPSESLFSKMAHRGGGRGGSGSGGSNKFGRLSEMELSSGGGSDAGDDATRNPLSAQSHDRFAY